MTIRGFVLGVVLLAAVGWCIVQESFKQTQARYRLAELSRREGEIRQRLSRLKTDEERLRSSAHLMPLIKGMDLVVLRTAKPENWEHSGLASKRQPGQVLDEAFTRRERPVTMASAGEW